MIEQFLSNFYGFTTSDVLLSILDVVIVWYILYQILMLIRGTKAMQVLLGLLLFAFLYFISKPNILDLAALNWTLDKFITSFVIILVIIFQEDIRRGLGEFGKTGGLATGGSAATLGASPIEEIIKAVSLLSDRRIGALIVIEMDAALDVYTVEGVKIDAQITKELLVSLFIPYKANPTHDGAVIIRNHRIDSAGCFLPLTSNDKVDKSLGTRHRAAIGLSESTDAIVIVVSEETGMISVAYRETLTRRLSPEALRDILHKFFVSPNAASEKKSNGAYLKRLFSFKKQSK